MLAIWVIACEKLDLKFCRRFPSTIIKYELRCQVVIYRNIDGLRKGESYMLWAVILGG